MGTWNEIDDEGNVISWAQCDVEVGLNPLPSHSLLPDLDADDHLQYLTAARGNTLYSLLLHTHVPADIIGTTWITNIVEDLSPQLGAPLDTNNQQIISTAGVNITITPGTTGDLVLDGLNWPQADGTANYVLETNGAGQLSWAAQTAGGGGGGLDNIVEDTTPQLGGNLDVTTFSIVSTSAADIAITPDTTGSVVLDGLNWPQADGTANYVLETDGSGQLSWIVQSGGINNVVEDTTPQLGSDLDVNGNSIVSVTNSDITITPNGTGRTRITGLEAPIALETQTGTTFTAFTLDHAEEMITMNNGATNTATLPANSSIAYPIGTKIHFQQLGGGATTIAITTDMLNVNANLTLVLNGQYAVATAMKMTATSWTLFGNLVAV